MKTFAFFLPQFHEIAENNEWWGKGFTEWVNVKAAHPMFKGHVQPKHPLNNNYYNLLDKNTMIWQTGLMQQAGVSGFIYYHYYFDGKLLLEKPAENLLKWKDIRQPFFFCWANHPWKRTWEGSETVLMPMDYGDVSSWERHFQYLLPFFKDSRYEKKDNKPLFMIFKSSFNCKKEMFQYFDMRCKSEGFEGICLIESYHGEISWEHFSNEKSNLTSYVFFREPAYSQFGYLKSKGAVFDLAHRVVRRLRKYGIVNKPFIINGNNVMKWKIMHEPLEDGIIHGLCFEWDNTPRHKQRGYVITGFDHQLFLTFMQKIKDEEYLFVNAWNEWAEGMILEPTEENGSKYLEWLRNWHEENQEGNK